MPTAILPVGTLPAAAVSLPILVPITDVETLKAAGIHHPKTLEGWRWAFRMRSERGLEKAFVRQGKTVLVNVPAYLAAVCGQAS